MGKRKHMSSRMPNSGNPRGTPPITSAGMSRAHVVGGAPAGKINVTFCNHHTPFHLQQIDLLNSYYKKLGSVERKLQ